jgi:hypothetical protein
LLGTKFSYQLFHRLPTGALVLFPVSLEPAPMVVKSELFEKIERLSRETVEHSSDARVRHLLSTSFTVRPIEARTCSTLKGVVSNSRCGHRILSPGNDHPELWCAQGRL